MTSNDEASAPIGLDYIRFLENLMSHYCITNPLVYLGYEKPTPVIFQDYFIRLEVRIPMSQAGFNGMSRTGFDHCSLEMMIHPGASM